MRASPRVYYPTRGIIASSGEKSFFRDGLCTMFLEQCIGEQRVVFCNRISRWRPLLRGRSKRRRSEHCISSTRLLLLMLCRYDPSLIVYLANDLTWLGNIYLLEGLSLLEILLILTRLLLVMDCICRGTTISLQRAVPGVMATESVVLFAVNNVLITFKKLLSSG